MTNEMYTEVVKKRPIVSYFGMKEFWVITIYFYIDEDVFCNK